MSVNGPIHDGVEVRQLSIAARNGQPIAITRFSPATRTSEPVPNTLDAIVISAAMATKASFYTPFARWLVTQGFVAYTYDYQGFGASMPPGRTLRDTKALMTDWMGDAATVVEFASANEPDGTRLHYLGQSLGGQLLAFTDTDRLTSATVVATGSGAVHLGDWPNRALAPLLWYVIAPVLTRLYGYFPGARFHILGNAPASLVRQWGRWCKQRDYMFHEHPELRQHYEAVRVPLTSIAFSDDETISARATAELEGWYANAPLTRLRFTPAELGLDRIGHIGIFRSGNSRAWPTVFAQLVAATQPRAQGHP